MSIDTRPGLGLGWEISSQRDRWDQIRNWFAKDPGSHALKVEVVSHYAVLLKAEGFIQKVNRSPFEVDDVVPHLAALDLQEDLTLLVLDREQDPEYLLAQKELADLTRGLWEGEKLANSNVRKGHRAFWDPRARIITARKLLKIATGKRSI